MNCSRLLLVLASAPLVASCAGKLSAGARPPSSEVDPEGERRRTPPMPLHRLSKRQYENTLRALLQAELPSHASAVWKELRPVLAQHPSDSLTKGTPFASMDQATSQKHVDTYFRASEVIADALTASEARIRALLACRDGQSDNACVRDYIARFGRRAFRHPLSDDELTYLRSVYGVNGIDAAALRDVIVVTLNAPQFLYRIELGAEPMPRMPGAFALTPYEVVTRLALQYWDAAPDEALLDAAEQGALATEARYEALVARVIGDPRAEGTLHAFVREWLELDSLRPLDDNVGTPQYDAFVGKDVPSPRLRDAMIDDVLRSFSYHLEHGDTFPDWFASPYSFATSKELARVYGAEAWGGQGQPPRLPPERAGLLTRAALLATGTAVTRPIKKGVFIRERILCDRLKPPPANATNLPPELEKTMTSREVVEALTEQPRSACSQCHASLINPLGYATEGFDGLGRARKEQTLYADDGRKLGSRPVNTKSIPRVWANDDTAAEGAHDLTRLILQSGRAEACFARQYLRFAYGRREDEQLDGATLGAVESALRGQSLRDAIRAPALRPEYRQRYVGDVQQ